MPNSPHSFMMAIALSCLSLCLYDCQWGLHGTDCLSSWDCAKERVCQKGTCVVQKPISRPEHSHDAQEPQPEPALETIAEEVPDTTTIEPEHKDKVNDQDEVNTKDEVKVPDVVKEAPPTPGVPYWLVNYGKSQTTQEGKAIVQDKAGNSFVVGRDDNQSLLMKIDPAGKIVWVFQLNATFGPNSMNCSFDIAMDSQGDLIVVGKRGEKGPNTTPAQFCSSSSSGGGVSISKWSAKGSLLWAKTASGFSDSHAQSVGVDANDNIYVLGEYKKNIKFGSISLESKGFNEVFVAKLDPKGDWKWVASSQYWVSSVKHYWGAVPNVIAVDADGSARIIGRTSTSTQFGATKLLPSDPMPPGSAGRGVDGFIARVDPDGNWLWAKSIPGKGDDYAEGLALDKEGNAYMGGGFSYDATFGTKSCRVARAGRGRDIFISKLSPKGDWLWTQCIGQVGDNVLRSIVVGAQKQLIVSGAFGKSIKFGLTTLNRPTSYNMFVAKMDSEGKFLWASGFGGNNYETRINDVLIDPSGANFVLGSFVDFIVLGNHKVARPNAVANTRNLFLYKLDVNGSLQ